MSSESVLERVISPARLSTYRNAVGGDLQQSLALYQWNADISAAFLPPLQMLEVTIRNAVAEAIEVAYGNEWAWNATFQFSLPNNDDQRKPLQRKAEKHSDISKIIADMNFIFWQKMFTSRFNENIWQHQLQNIFPNIKETTISKLYGELDSIRRLRNRIAHHEPIFNRNLESDLENILKVINYRSDIAKEWVVNSQNVTTLLKLKPQT